MNGDDARGARRDWGLGIGAGTGSVMTATTPRLARLWFSQIQINVLSLRIPSLICRESVPPYPTIKPPLTGDFR
jgi:hypothetical protein